jgi:hypothetical protein
MIFQHGRMHLLRFFTDERPLYFTLLYEIYTGSFHTQTQL